MARPNGEVNKARRVGEGVAGYSVTASDPREAESARAGAGRLAGAGRERWGVTHFAAMGSIAENLEVRGERHRGREPATENQRETERQ